MEVKQLTKILNSSIMQVLADVHTTTIAKVTAVNESTINCRPVINRTVGGESVELPEFIEVPLITLQGGGNYITLPVIVDDYCVLFITERCFDRWWDGQDYKPPLELRMHDYSDGLALVGVNPLSATITIPEEITIKGVVRMGVVDPTDFVALASKVLSELNSVKTDLDGFKTVFDAHVHPGVGSPTATPFNTPHTPASVASDWVKAE